MYKLSPDRQVFRDKFIEFAQSVEYGTFITDEDLQLMINASGIKITLATAKVIINSLEKKIGKFYKKRFLRERGNGYRILHPDEQIKTAVSQGKRKVTKALSQTKKRLEHTDLDKLPVLARTEVERRISAIANAQFIIGASAFKPSIDLKNLSLLNHVKDEFKILANNYEKKKSVI